MTKNYYTEVEREQLCKRYQSGKQSRQEFCAAHDISTKSLSRWLSKLKQKPKESKFIVAGKLAGSTNITTDISLPGGIAIKLQLDAPALANLIRGLL